MPTTEQNRRYRYKREPNKKGFKLQERDKEIIQLVYRYRFLNSRHISAFFENSHHKINKRLTHLFHNSYLARPRTQKTVSQKGDSYMIYGIANKGAELLREEYGAELTKTDWTRKNTEIGDYFLKHQLEISNFMICFKLACRGQDDVEFMDFRGVTEDWLGKKEKSKQIDRWKVPVKPSRGSKFVMTIIPDQIFGLYFPNDPPGRNRALFFLEADRSTMPVVRNNLRQSSFLKKLIGYWESYQADLYKKHFGIKGARMLTVAKSDDRINNIIKANKDLIQNKGSRMFLFLRTDQVDIENPGRLLKKVWQNGRDKELIGLLV